MFRHPTVSTAVKRDHEQGRMFDVLSWIDCDNRIVTPILWHGVNCNAISGQGVHVTPYPNPTGPVVGSVWYNMSSV